MHLPMTDIERVNRARAAINKHLGKAAGRGTDIKTNTVSGIKPKMIQRRRQFDAAPRDIRMCCAGPQRCVDRNLFRRLAYNPFIGSDEARRNGGLCFGAAVKQTALDQQAIGALSRGQRSILRRVALTSRGNNVPRTTVTCVVPLAPATAALLSFSGEAVWHVDIQEAHQ